MRQTLKGGLLAALLAAAPAIVQAQAADPAAAQIQRFDESLLSVMKDAKHLSAQQRYERLEPIISRTFDLPMMTRFAVGPTWTSVPAAQQAALVKAFSRMTVASYAHNFSGYSGQHFVLNPQVETRGPDKLVRTQLVGGGSSVSLNYRMRESGGTWKVIDVYYNGAVSSLVGERSEYAATLRSGGAPALVRNLDSRADKLLAGH